MHILLVSPRDRTYASGGGAFTRSLSYYALTLPTLAALVPPELGASVRIVDEGVEELSGIDGADLVALTAVTPSAKRAYEIAAQAKAAGKTVVIGGPHATLLPGEALAHADAVVAGFAEDTWPALLRDFAAGRLRREYRSQNVLPAGDAPRPRRDLLRREKYLGVDCVQSSRGCSNRCDFCTIPRLWGPRPHTRPVAEVVAEIAGLRSRSLVFLDPALADDREHALRLFREMAPLRRRWVALANAHAGLDDVFVREAARAGCRGLLLGFESVNPGSLRRAGKHMNAVERYGLSVRKLHDAGIGVLGCFVFGLEEDDESVFERTVEFADRARIDVVRYAVLTPYPGTPLFAAMDAERRILTRDWDLYDMQHVVFRPRLLSPRRLQEGLWWAWRETTRLSSIVARTRCSGAMHLALAANLGFRVYARRTRALPVELEGLLGDDRAAGPGAPV